MEGAVAVGVIGFALFWWILEIIGNWKLFAKAGKPGWHSIIPILNIYDEYDLCWKGSRGILMLIALVVVNSVSPEAQESSAMIVAAGIAGVVLIYLQIKESYKLAKAFGKGLGYTIFLIIFDRIARIVLGFGSAQYIGKK